MADNSATETQDSTFESGSEFVSLSVTEGVGIIRVDRPKMNPLNGEIQLALGKCAEEATRRDDVAAVVITGGERCFAAGADIKEMVNITHADMIQQTRLMTKAFDSIARMPKPSVAAINGYALGGGFELAMCADLRFMADDAKVGQPEVTLGVIPGLGGTQRLTRLIGPSRAKDLLFTGRLVGAEEALQIGMVNKVFPAAEVQQAAIDWAKQFVNGPAMALGALKDCVDGGLDRDLHVALQLEGQWFSALFDSADKKAGMQAFIDKEKPKFIGR